MRDDRAALPAAMFAGVLVAAILAIAGFEHLRAGVFMGDYRAFYCSGSLALHAQNPYESVPLSACEAQPVPSPLFTARHGEVLPAPLPGYIIAAFVPLATIPLPVSAALWLGMLCAACALTVALLVRLQLGSAAAIAVVFAIPLAAVSLPVGELPPIALCGIALAALGMSEKRPIAAAAGIALAMAEPQAGIAVLIAAFVLSPGWWRVLLPIPIAMIGLSVAVLGPSHAWQYVHTVLPAHLYAELPRVTQYSLSWMAASLGASPPAALALGRLWYVAMLAAAVFIARSRTGRENPDFAVFAGAACSVTLGPFLHLDHIALAIPAAIWLLVKRPSARTAALVIALAVPVLFLFPRPLMLVPAIGVAFATVVLYTANTQVALRAAALTVVVIAGIEILVVKAGVGARTLSSPAIALPQAQASWAQYVRAHDIMTGWALWIVKLPTWLATIATSGVAISLASRRGLRPAAPLAESRATE